MTSATRRVLFSPFWCWLFMRLYRLFARYAANRTGNLLCVSAERVSLGCGICHVTASGTSQPVCALVGLFQCCGFFLLAVSARTSIAVSLGAGRRSRERSWRGWSRKCRACFAHCLQSSVHIFFFAYLKEPAPHPFCEKAEEIPPCGGGHTFTPLGHFAERIRPRKFRLWRRSYFHTLSAAPRSI